jgi:hypothetical protein
MRTSLLRSATLCALACAPLAAADWYVRAGADGDGSAKDKPLGVAWKALEKCARGDVIHIAAGTYYGKTGCGHWVVNVPQLTLVGGYNADFSARNPFTNFTRLEKAKDYKGGVVGQPDGMIAGKQGVDISGLIVDGFVFNAQARNSYDASGKIQPKDCEPGMLVEGVGTIKLRNSILLNPYGDGVYCTWKGEGNEVANNFILNTFYSAVETRSAQPDSVITIKNNTIAFCWQQPGKGGSIGIMVGRQGKTIIQDNVIAFMQCEDAGQNYGVAVNNNFGNDETVLKGNVFAQCMGGPYAYMDASKANLLLWKPEEIADLNKDPESYRLAKGSTGNLMDDPKLNPDKDWFEKFSNFVASKPGKLNMDAMNQWRQTLGLPLQAEPGSPRKNWGMAYPLDKVVGNLVSKIPGKGVQVDKTFETYSGGGAPAAAGGAAAPAAEAKTYAETAWDAFKKGAAGLKDLKDKPVQVRAGMGPGKTDWLLAAAARDNYDCVALNLPGEAEMSMKYAFGYLLKGSPAHKEWQKLAAKKAKFAKEGLIIKGTASYVGKDSYAYPVGIIIDEVAAP